MKITKNFSLKEFIDPETYKQYGNKSVWFIDPSIISIAQLLRDRLGIVLYINTWYIPGGSFKYSGFRPPECQTGARLSQHKFGRAIDVKTIDFDANGADLIRDEIINNFSTYKDLGLTTIEDSEFAPTWCHLDIRTTNKDNLFILEP